MSELVVRASFDEAIFGVPFFRLTDPAADGVEAVFRAAVAPHPDAMADARASVHDRDTHRHLLGLDFHRVCTQVTLAAPPSSAAADQDVTQAERWPLSEDAVALHAAGFRSSRFGQDPHTPTQLAERWIATWLTNSVTGRRRVLAIGPDVITYAPPDSDGVLVVDLVSVIRKRRGHGRKLVDHLRGLAGRIGASEVRVTTEAENMPAQRLYIGAGFVPVDARACFHFASRPSRATLQLD